METNRVHVVIDDAAVASATDVLDLIEPLVECVDIDGSWARYARTLRPFSSSQRYLFAIWWYRSAVNHDGHEHFFWSVTGIVWEDALIGLDAIGLPQAREILTTASARLRGASRERLRRHSQLQVTRASFEDLDDRFYALERTGAFSEKMLAFARQHAADFRFKGFVERDDLLRRRDAPFPLPEEQLEELFAAVGTGVAAGGCDHSLRFTQAWLRNGSHQVDAVVAWLEGRGGYCDCEVLMNACPRWMGNWR
jgi:hypothetical protein